MSDERRVVPLAAPIGGSAAIVPDVVPAPSSKTDLAESIAADGDTPSGRSGPRDSSPGLRRRGRTLRIPDDEVARPPGGSEGPPDDRGSVEFTPTPSMVDTGVVLMPMRIISIDPDPNAPAQLDEAPFVLSPPSSQRGQQPVLAKKRDEGRSDADAPRAAPTPMRRRLSRRASGRPSPSTPTTAARSRATARSWPTTS
jgi:hypothetical protein